MNWYDQYRIDLLGLSRQDLLWRLSTDGLVIVDRIRSADDALHVARVLGVIRPHRDSREDGVTLVTNQFPRDAPTGYHGFSNSRLPLHTDRSVASRPPTYLFLWCEKPAETGGETLLVDGRGVYQRLAHLNPDIFSAVTKAKSTIFASDGELYWGSIYERTEANKLVVRFRSDDLLFVSAEITSAIHAFRGVLESSSLVTQLEAGQGYILQNTRWLHGRLPFAGERRYGRLHIDPVEHEREACFGFDDPLVRVAA